jgi:hypothetical protein
VVLWRLRSRGRVLEGAKASARAAVERLAHYVETVHPGHDPVAERLLADATERWHTAGALIARASTAGEYKVARVTAREGLHLVDQACQRLGLPGPAAEQVSR